MPIPSSKTVVCALLVLIIAPIIIGLIAIIGYTLFTILWAIIDVMAH